MSVCVRKVLNFGQPKVTFFRYFFCLGFQRFLLLIHMSHLFFSLSLFSLASKIKNERERTVSRSSYRAKPKARFVLCFIIGMVAKRFEPNFFSKVLPRVILRDQHQTLEARRRRRQRRRRRRGKEISRGGLFVEERNKRLDLNFFLSFIFTSRSLTRSFFFRARERKREFSFYALKTL